MKTAEDLFRFAATRAPAGESVDALELPADAAVEQWIQEEIGSEEWKKAVANQLATFRETFGSSAADAFRTLQSTARSRAVVRTRELLDGPFVENKRERVAELYRQGWRRFIQGIRLDHPRELEELRQLLLLTTVRMRWYSGDATVMAAGELERLLKARVRLPSALVTASRKRWSDIRSKVAEAERRLGERGRQAVETEISTINRLQRAAEDLKSALRVWSTAGAALSSRSAADAAISGLMSDDLIQVAVGAAAEAGGNALHVTSSAPEGTGFWKANDALLQHSELKAFNTNNSPPANAADDLTRSIAERVAKLARLPHLRASDLQAFDDINIQLTLTAALNSRQVSRADADVRRYGMRPIGVADLRVVKQVLVRYEKGELAHIENVLHGEERLRRHSRIEKIEESRLSLSESEVESSKDVQSTDRFEVSRESKRLISEQQENVLGAKVSGSYGTVSFEASTDISTQRNAEQSLVEASKSSREVVDHAVENVRNRVVEQRSVKSSVETRETVQHKQSAPDGHIVGQYRWVDKIYRAQLHNYGARAMYEFMVPKPAAMFHHLLAKGEEPGGLVGPAPRRPEIRAHEITELTWLADAETYGVTLAPPPPYEVVETVQVGWVTKDNDKPVITGQFSGFQGLEKGYRATTVGCGRYVVSTGPNGGVAVAVGGVHFKFGSPTVPWIDIYDVAMPIGYYVVGWGNIQSFAVGLQLRWQRTLAAYEKWQLECYSKIMERYEEQAAAYQDKLAAAGVGRGQTASTMTDTQMRTIERNELKRSIVEIARFFREGSGAVAATIYGSPPRIDPANLDDAASEVRFFESAFEWDQMVYLFHPYFWSGTASTWGTPFASKGDATFSAFLQAGFANVVLPVRPGFEHAVAAYWETGEISRGPIVAADEMLAKMNTEVTQRNDLADDGYMEGEPWQYKVPTSLVILEDGIGAPLPDFSGELPEPVSPFIPSENRCDGRPYNAASWPSATGPEVATELRHLGYPIPYGEGQTLFQTEKVKSLVTAFQSFCNSEGISKVAIKKDLLEQGQTDPCTLLVLSHCRRLRRSGAWTGPAKAVA